MLNIPLHIAEKPINNNYHLIDNLYCYFLSYVPTHIYIFYFVNYH